jgi:syntaxin 18
MTHQSHPCLLRMALRMAQDITGDFRNIVEQKRKGLDDTRRTKLRRQSHSAPKDTQVDGVPPFMQAYMKEAYTIVSHVLFCLPPLLTREKLQQVSSLTRMLAAVRRAYLDVHARLPPVTRQVVRALDTTGVDAWADIKYFTNAECDQIDVQAQKILARCADRVHDMETLQKRAPPCLLYLPYFTVWLKLVIERAERVAQSFNPLYRLLPALLVTDDVAAASDFVSAHCAGVTWYLTRRLTQVSQMLRDMQEERVRRETERTRTLGSDVARELVGINSTYASEPAEPGSGSWFGTASSALGGSWAVHQRPPPEEMDLAISDDDEDDVELSASQIQQFEAENAQILRSAEDSLAAVRQAEARLLEISALQAELVAQLTRQTEVSDQLYEDAIATSEMVEKGNVQLHEARRRARDGRKWLLLFLIGASLSLLFLHYY